VSQPQTAAIILAGGKSTRLGRDKASEPLLGRPLLQHVLAAVAPQVDEVIVVTAQDQRLPDLAGTSITVVDDAYPDSGPLGGIYTGLSVCAAPYAFVAACDMPLLKPALISELLRLAPGHNAVVPVDTDCRTQPLCAVYSRLCVDLLRARLDARELRVNDVLDALSPLYLTPDQWRHFDANGVSFFNLNREEDFVRAAALLSAP